MGARRERANSYKHQYWSEEIFSERGTPSPTQGQGGVPIDPLGREVKIHSQFYSQFTPSFGPSSRSTAISPRHNQNA